MDKILIVIPCYNEENRLNKKKFLQFLVQHPDIFFVFVNDGSTDQTQKILETMHSNLPQKTHIIHQKNNQGKSEAVRAGLLKAIELNATITGYFDADLSTPLSEINHLLEKMRQTKRSYILGSRFKSLGTNIQRKAWRHYTGRVFATFASNILKLDVYDTQCGAKLFNASPTLKNSLATPFISRWAFDVELIARILQHPNVTQKDFLEVPLHEWIDQGKSKLTLTEMLKTFFDLIKIAKKYR